MIISFADGFLFTYKEHHGRLDVTKVDAYPASQVFRVQDITPLS